MNIMTVVIVGVGRVLRRQWQRENNSDACYAQEKFCELHNNLNLSIVRTCLNVPIHHIFRGGGQYFW